MLDITGRTAWTDEEIRQRCQSGTIRELHAYLGSGYTLSPTDPDFKQMSDVADEVCAKHLVSLKQLKSLQKTTQLVAARTEFCVICYTTLAKSTPEIAKFLGDRDHSTILHLLRKAGVKRRVASTKKFICKNGHARTKDNVYDSGKCKTCAREWWRKDREFKKQLRAMCSY